MALAPLAPAARKVVRAATPVVVRDAARPAAKAVAAKPAAAAERTFGAKLMGWINTAFRAPTQFYFDRISPLFSKVAGDASLKRFGRAEVDEILKHAKPGDVILWGSSASFVHGSVYMGDGTIVHALANNGPKGQPFGVLRERIEDYVARVERHRVIVMRPKGFTPAETQETMDFARRQLGKDYDNLFRQGADDSFYCTELAWAALQHGANKPDIPLSKKLLGLMTVVETDGFRKSKDLEQVFAKNAPPLTP